MARPRPEGLDAEWMAHALRAMSYFNVWLYRSSRGRLGQIWLHGAPLCLLTTTGRHTGKPRTAPLVYWQRESQVAVVAARGGLPGTPQWYLNLQANPEAELQMGAEVRKVRARTAEGEERAKLWRRLLRVYPDYDDYQAWADEPLPVVR